MQTLRITTYYRYNINGTNAQKEKLNYCIKQYQQSKNVDLDTIMNNHLLEVMQTCDQKVSF